MMTETSFQRYCENTSLHGWQYIYVKSSKGWRILWMGMVLSSVIIACCFVFKQTSEFTKATVVTTVDTTTAPLSDVFFPAVTICNINQVKLSLSLFLYYINSKSYQFIILSYNSLFHTQHLIISEK